MRHPFLAAGAVALWLACPGRSEAQIDLTGMWAPIFHEDQIERIPGPDVGDYAGLPISEAARIRALAWDASLLTLPEHQCKPHPSTYGFRGVGNLRIWPEYNEQTEQLQKLNTHIQWQEQRREIWLDGREHPPDYAPHTWQGFSTGRWEGNVLVVRTTHLKGGWMRRNGLALSDWTTMTERFIRHGDILTHVYIIEDPIYLTEPLVRTNGFQRVAEPNLQPYPCLPAVEVPRAKGEVPHHLPGRNPFAEDFARKHGIPLAAAMGGAATALPEFTRTPSPAATPAGDARPAPVPPRREGGIRSWHVQGNVWLVTSPVSNTAVSIGPDGVLVVDTMTDALAEELIAEINRLSGNKPIRYIINTHVHPDHTGGNLKVAAAGRSIVGGNFAGQVGAEAANRAFIIAHEQVLNRMSHAEGADEVPVAAWPTDTFFVPEHELYFNGEAIQLLHQPNAHTDGDILVFFRKSDVVVAGGLFSTVTFPAIDLARGGSLDGAVAALNRILDLTIPADKQEGGTYVIPGHGRLVDEADVVDYRDMVTIIRDRLRDAIGRGLTLEQVKAERLLGDYEARYGSTGPWTADRFLEAAYRSLGGR